MLLKIEKYTDGRITESLLYTYIAARNVKELQLSYVLAIGTPLPHTFLYKYTRTFPLYCFMM